MLRLFFGLDIDTKHVTKPMTQTTCSNIFASLMAMTYYVKFAF